MLLTSVSFIREQLGFDDMTDINAAITAALHSAEPYLVSRMNMVGFARETATDTFFVDSPTFKKLPMVNTVMRLRNGLLTEVHSMTRSGGVVDGDPVSVHVDGVHVDKAKGLISDMVHDYSREFVRVTYTYGFEADSDNASSYDLTQVPSWLQEAAKVQTLILLKGHPSLEDSKVAIDATGLKRQLDVMMANFIRYAPTSIGPL